MKMEYLEYFVKVVDCGSISAASNELFITPQGLSQAIQQLERDYNISLFYREGNRLKLTNIGEDVYRTARDLLKINDTLIGRITAYTEGNSHSQSTELTIFSSPLVNMTFLPKVLDLFHKRNAQINVQISEISPEDMLEKLSTCEKQDNTILIFALPWYVLERIIRDKPVAFDFYELLRCPLLGCVSGKSHLAKKKSFETCDLQDSSLVIYNVDEKILSQLNLDQDKLNVILRSSNLFLCRSIIASDKNVIGLTNEVIEQFMKTTSLYSAPIQPRVDIVYGFMLNPKDRYNFSVQEFINILQAEFKV